MVLVGIPYYNSKDTIRDTLNSLVSQTRKNFFVCICDDKSDEPVDSIVEEYRDRLNIKVLHQEENRGPGMARQAILNYAYGMKPACDYIIFVDADDMLYPRAIDLLYTESKKNGLDICTSEVFCESEGQDGFILDNAAPVTWFHGKCYRLNYLKDSGISFLEELRYNEDSYFNLVAHLNTDNIAYIPEVTYLWKNNKNSVTRRELHFTPNHNNEYLYSQVRAMDTLLDFDKLNKLAPTLCNIYHSYEQLVLLNPNYIEWANEIIYKLFDKIKEKDLLKVPNFVVGVSEFLKQSTIQDDKVIFYPHSFNSWCKFFGVRFGGSNDTRSDN